MNTAFKNSLCDYDNHILKSLEHQYKLQQRQSSSRLALIRREIKKRQKLSVNNINH